ncbi:cyclic nucleotide-binding/CBS domain-containing protein [Halorientalis brevis]|uniref:Cyclic nucleotide-binding/CBS domain-containing protein n=1 Tax=Halorientalis brevis TaxID=1126241 RepID=A0ABD6CB58_9EURY|nr:CBS domain-containing protein [Halorientalis brevis]
MNGDVTVREVMRREYVGASEADTLVDTAALMLEENVEAVVVLRGSEPVGILTQRDLLQAAVDQGDLESMLVKHAMKDDPPTVSASESLATATNMMSGTSARRLLVMENGEPIGVVSEHDIVTAATLTPQVNGETRQEVKAESVTAEAATTAGESTTSEDEYSNQGICEICGSLTRDLSSFNGQLVCSDCKNV